jgi:pimeloyl-ACP methyl ester carboxylesterase/class 3 adenylate cyclase
MAVADSGMPETRYAESSDLSIAYQVFGHGSRDLVYVPGIVSHVELAWEDPHTAAFLRGLAEAFRVIVFDKRGQGMSDRIDGVPSLEERIDDLRAVMEAAGSERATVFGLSEGGPMSLLFAASYPEKVDHLVLFGAMARFDGAEDYPHRPPLEAYIDDFVAAWGKGVLVPLMASETEFDSGFPEWLARFERMSASPSAIRKFLMANKRIDVRPILEDVRLPTLIIQRRDDKAVAHGNGRYLADNISGAVYLELPGSSHLPWLGNSDLVVASIVRFAEAGDLISIGEGLEERRLATALFTDIVQSTEQLAAMGDQRWREMLDRHDHLAENLVHKFRGRIVKNTGDGILALFDGPTRGLYCAQHVLQELGGIGLGVRAGLHIGEIVARNEDITGLAVNIAARVMGEAKLGEVLVTKALMDLTGGSDITFKPAGTHNLRGVPGTFDLFRPLVP